MNPNNRMLAKYMGQWKIHSGKFIAKVHGGWWDEYRLQYDSSWEWLMDVVNKIGDNYDHVEIKIDEGVASCHISCYVDGVREHTINIVEGKDLHDIVYQAAVAYVKWLKEIRSGTS